MYLTQNINLIKVLLCFLAFSSGLGIEFPFINIFGNFNVADVFLCAYVFIFLRPIKFNRIALFPILIGMVGLLSICYNVFLTSSYHQIDLAGFPIVFRWMYFGFLICLFHTYCRSIEDLKLYFYSLLLGVLVLTMFSWYNWRSELTYFAGFPVLAFIKELNANTLGFYFCSIISILILLYKLGYLTLPGFALFFALIFTSTVSTISKAAILTTIFVIIMSTKIGLSSLIGLGILGIALVYTFADLALKRWGISGGSNQDRLTLINNAYEMFLSSPIFGVGPKGYTTTGLTKVTDAHNALFNILAEYGLLGVSLYLAFIVSLILRTVPKTLKFSSHLGYFFLIYIVSVQMLGMTTGLTYSDKISWIVIGCILGVVTHSTCNEDNYQSKKG